MAIANVLIRRCSEVATCSQIIGGLAGSGEDGFHVREASGRQASCSASVDWPASVSSGVREHRSCGTFYRKSSISRAAASSVSGLPSRNSALWLSVTGTGPCQRSRTVLTGLLGPGSMRYVGRQEVFRIRGSSGDAEGLQSFPQQRPRPRRRIRKGTKLKGIALSASAVPSATLHTIQCSMAKAFSSMVLMLKTLQSYALQMRSMLYYEDFESVAHVIHREMQASLLWLFQQVFAGTPMLMVSVMVLFSDFTAHSASTHISVHDIPSAAIVSGAHSIRLSLAEVVYTPLDPEEVLETNSSGLTVMNFGGDIGGRGGRNKFTASPFDESHDSWNAAEPPEQTFACTSEPHRVLEGRQAQAAELNTADVLIHDNALRLLEETLQEMRLGEGKPLTHLRLDQEVVRQLVAPVSIQLEADDYVCFDKTDLEYQHAIKLDPNNPLLLSNFAQFLYIVRHDYDRSELYFHRALREDPTDGDILGRYATFLWLGRKDKDAAERAFKAALASNPDNPYYSGSYAHFLWHSGDDEVVCPIA